MVCEIHKKRPTIFSVLKARHFHAFRLIAPIFLRQPVEENVTICESNLPLFSGVLASSSPFTSMGTGAALLDGGVGVAAADVGELPPPEDEAPVAVVVVVVVFDTVDVTNAAAAAAAAAADAAELAKLGTNSKAFTFNVENFALISFESLSWAIFVTQSLSLPFHKTKVNHKTL